MTAEEFVDILEAQKLLPSALVDKLREKAQGPKALSAKALAKFLIDKGHLTKHQAASVLQTASATPTAAKPATKETKPQTAKPKKAEPKPSSKAPNTAATTADDDLFGGMPDLGAPLDDLSGGLGGFDSPLDSLDNQGLTSGGLASGGLGGSAALAGEESSKKSSKSKSKKRKSNKKSNEWDSPLLLIGGGALVLLLIGSGVMYVILNWESGDKLIATARELSATGSYSAAVENYERFVEKFSTHEQASKARVELALVRIRQAVESNNFVAGFAIARDELKAVDNEAAFGTAETELSALLPAIAKGLSKQADESADAEKANELAADAEVALAMCENTRYIPTTLRDETELNEVRETLTRIQRRQVAQQSLSETLTTIDVAIASGDTRGAYEAQRALVKKHPELAGDQQLGEALQEISQAEQSAIKFVADPIESQTTEAPSAVVATLVLANQFATGSAPIEGPHVFIFGSAAYAVDAANGQLLWRRHLGPQVNLADPVMVGSDVLLFSTIGNELLKLNATSGKLQWRLPLGEVVSQAVVAGNRVFLASESAKLHVVDLASGRREGFVQFAQPLRAAPAVDASGGKLYLSGDHSSLYTLSANDLSCTGVYFSGHAAGTIVVPPALVLNKLAVVENDGAETCRLRLFSVNRDGVIDKELAASRLDGLVLQPLSTTGRRFVVNTDRGTLAVFDVNPGAEGQALTQLAKQTERGSQSYLRYAAMDDRDIWYASRELSKLVVAPTGNRMVVQEVKDDYQGSLFLGPIAVRNGVLLHTRQRGDNPAVTVTATLARDGSTLWQTDLASPPAGGIIASNDPPLLLLAGADGNTFAFDRAAIQARVQNQALPRLSVEFPPLTHGLALPGGRAAFTAAKASKALLFDTNQSPPLQAVELPAPLACEPIALGSGWIAPLAVGQVVYLDSATGKEMAGAFQPPLPPGTEKQWLVPTALDGEAPRFVISDGIEKIYLVELDANKSFLAAVQEAEVGTTPLSTRLASIGNRVFAGSRDGRLVSFTLPGLELDTRVELASTVVWGPYRVGNIVVVATQAGELFAVGDDGQKLWQVQSPASDFAGAPLADGTSVVIPFASGKLVAMAADSGQKVGVSATGQSFVGGAEKLQNMFVVATQDGSILVVSPPNGN